MDAAAATTYIDQLSEKLTEHLKELIGCNSFRFNPAGIDAAGQIVASWFEPLGFSGESIQSTVPGAGHHLILTKKGSSDKNLIYIAHLDTVYPPDENDDTGFPIRIEGDRLYGPGAADCKGGIVLFRQIMTALKQLDPSLYEKLSCTFLLNATEEGGCEDFPVLLKQRVNENTLGSIGLEPGRISREGGNESGFTIARKGSRRFLLEVTGREAHSGVNHPYGVNAIRELARKIEIIESLTDYNKGITLNVGTVSGGTSVNTVPGYARAEIDLRFDREEDLSPVISRLKTICKESTVDSPVDSVSTQQSLTEGFGYPAWPEGEHSSTLVQLILSCAKKAGQLITPQKSGGGSDSAYVAGLVAAADSLGPAGSNFHITGQEYVLLSSFLSRALLHLCIIDSCFSDQH